MAFRGTTDTVKKLGDTVLHLESQISSLKRKRSDSVSSSDSEAPHNKRQPETDVLLQPENVNAEVSNDVENDDLDWLFSNITHNHEESNCPEDDEDLLRDLDDLYKEESKVGTPISPDLAGVLNRALRAIPDGTEKEVDKIRQLRGKYIRQDNMDSLQVRRIDSFLWRQLKRDTKSRDSIYQQDVYVKH